MPPKTRKEKIKETLQNCTSTECITILDDLLSEYRKKNSIRINKGQVSGKVDPDRPDTWQMQ